MTLLQIQYAISCFHTGSISKSAQENYTSVANLSKALKALESELNYALFFRSHSGLVHTKKGRNFWNTLNQLQSAVVQSSSTAGFFSLPLF